MGDYSIIGQYTNGNQTMHEYDALGNRVRTTYYTRKSLTAVPIGNILHPENNTSDYTITVDGFNENIVYAKVNPAVCNGTTWKPKFVHNPEGMMRHYSYEEHYPFYFIKDHLGNIRETYINPAPNTKYLIQRMQYYPSGIPWKTSTGAIEHPYRYNGKELVQMHSQDEYDSHARWYYPAICRTTTMDPLCEKYYNISPYAWCGNNPVNVIDPSGCDTVTVTYNSDTNHWDLGTPIIAKGNDVINVTDKDGNTTSYEFSEGEYGKRICSVRLESTEQQTLGMFYLSGAGVAGYSVEPAGEPNNAVQDEQPIETGIYNIERGDGPKWTGWPRQYSTSESNYLGSNRAVCIHYAGNHDGNYELKSQDRIAVRWSTKCMVVSNDYTLDKSGYVLYNSIKSFNTALGVAKYCGASGYTVRTTNNGNGNYYICNGIKNYGIIRIIK